MEGTNNRTRQHCEGWDGGIAIAAALFFFFFFVCVDVWTVTVWTVSTESLLTPQATHEAPRG
jgi:hypothetical protein